MTIVKDIYRGSIPIVKMYKGNTLYYEREIPSTYTRLEYLQGDGKSWIDTGFTPNQDTSIEIKFTRELNGLTRHGCVYATESPRYSLYTIVAYTCPYRADYNTTMKSIITDTYNPLTKCGVPIVHFQDKNKVYINGELKHTFTYEEFTCNKSLFLFAANGYNTDSSNSRSKSKIYYCKIYDNGVLVRCLIPCLDADNVPCMYDNVNKVTYYNAGNGILIAGGDA